MSSRGRSDGTSGWLCAASGKRQRLSNKPRAALRLALTVANDGGLVTASDKESAPVYHMLEVFLLRVCLTRA